MFPENLKKMRKKLGYSVKKLAEETGTPESTIWGYEGNKRIPSIEFPIQLHRLYRANLNWLLTDEGEMFIKEQPKFDDVKADIMSEVQEMLKEKGII